MPQLKKPKKKTDFALFEKIQVCIERNEFSFTRHCLQRMKERKVSQIQITNLLMGLHGFERKRNKTKDRFEQIAKDWSYCIEGKDYSFNHFRVIVSLYLNGDVFIQSYDYSNDLSCGQLFKLIEALKAKSKLTKSSFTSSLILVEQRTENLLDVYLRLKDRDLLNPKQTRFATIDPETKEIEFLRETLVSECGEQC